MTAEIKAPRSASSHPIGCRWPRAWHPRWSRQLVEYEKELQGKTAVTAAQIQEAPTVGTELLTRLEPEGTKSADPTIEAVKARSERIAERARETLPLGSRR